MKYKKSGIIVLLTIVLILLVTGLYNVVNAVNCAKNDPNAVFHITYAKEGVAHQRDGIFGKFDGHNIYCSEKNGTLYGSSLENPTYYYKKDGNSHKYTSKSEKVKFRKYSYLYANTTSTKDIQAFIWDSDWNEGTDIELSDKQQDVLDSVPIKKYENPNVKVDTSKAKATIEVEQEKDSDGKNKEVKYVVIGPIKINYSGGIQKDPNRQLTVEVRANGEKIDGWKRKNGQQLYTISSGTEVYLKCPKGKVDGLKEVNVHATYKVYSYWCEYQKYKGTGYVGDKAVDGEGQELIGLNAGRDSDSKSDSGKVKLTQPRLITTKYIKKITSEDGKTLYDVTDSWNPNNWETENLKPIVTVNTNKGITETGRYNLTPQDARNFNITSGDIITYNIRVYNVGNETADLSDTSLKSINENKILKDGYIYDYYDNHLEFVSNNKNWQKDSSGVYKIKATELTNKIASYEEAKENGKEDNIESWSKSIQITFRVKDKEQSKYSITNNGNTTQREDATVKFLKSVTTKDKDGNDVETVFDKEPEVEIDTSKKVGEDDRIIINANTPDVTVMDGDTLTYCMRYYSTALNKTELNYKAIDKFRRRVRI